MKTIISILAVLTMYSNLSLAATGFYCEKDHRPADGNYNKLVFVPSGFGLFDIYQSFAPGGMRMPGSEVPKAFENKKVAEKIYCEIDTQNITVACSRDGQDIDFGVIPHNNLPEGFLIGIVEGEEVSVFAAGKDCYITR